MRIEVLVLCQPPVKELVACIIVVYLDHAATSWPKPPEVVARVSDALSSLTANAGRSGHDSSIQSARLVFQTRECLAERFGIARSENLLFVKGCTEGLNLVIKGVLAPESIVAVSPMEHNSVMRPLMRLARQYNVQIEALPADRYGRIDLEASGALSQRVDLVAVCHASNVNGSVQDLIGLREVFSDVPLLVDAAQTAGVLPIDMRPVRSTCTGLPARSERSRPAARLDCWANKSDALRACSWKG